MPLAPGAKAGLAGVADTGGEPGPAPRSRVTHVSDSAARRGQRTSSVRYSVSSDTPVLLRVGCSRVRRKRQTHTLGATVLPHTLSPAPESSARPCRLRTQRGPAPHVTGWHLGRSLARARSTGRQVCPGSHAVARAPAPSEPTLASVGRHRSHRRGAAPSPRRYQGPERGGVLPAGTAPLTVQMLPGHEGPFGRHSGQQGSPDRPCLLAGWNRACLLASECSVRPRRGCPTATALGCRFPACTGKGPRQTAWSQGEGLHTQRPGSVVQRSG